MQSATTSLSLFDQTFNASNTLIIHDDFHQKNTKKVAAPVARDEEKERAAAAERKEKARMKKEAESGIYEFNIKLTTYNKLFLSFLQVNLRSKAKDWSQLPKCIEHYTETYI